MQELSKKADELSKNANEFENENNKLKIQLETMEQQQKKQIETGVLAHKELQLTIDQLQTKTAEEQKQILALESEVAKIEQLLKDLATEAHILKLKLKLQEAQAKAEAASTIAHLTELAHKLQFELEKYAILESENSELEKEKLEVRSQLATLEKDNSELKQDNSELKQENSRLKQEKSTQLDAKVLLLEEQNKELKQQNRHLIENKTKDSGNLTAANQTILILRQEVAQLNKTLDIQGLKKGQKSQKTEEQNLSIKFHTQLEELRTQKDQEIQQVKSQKDKEIEELKHRIKKFQTKMEEIQSQRDKEMEKVNKDMQKVMTDNREHRSKQLTPESTAGVPKLGTPESTAGVPGRPSSGLSSARSIHRSRNKSHGEPTARPESKITTMTVQKLEALYNEYSKVPQYITKHTLDCEPNLAWNRQLNNLKQIKDKYKRTAVVLPSIIPLPDTINAQDVQTIENIETKIAQMICSVERTATMEITGGDAQIRRLLGSKEKTEICDWLGAHYDFMQRARELDASQVNIRKLANDVFNLPPFLRNKTINQFLETEDNDIKGKVGVLIEEFEHLHQQSHTDDFTVADRQRLEKLKKIMVHLLCWIEQKRQNKSRIEDTAQELQLSYQEKHEIEQWAQKREKSDSQQVQQGEDVQVEDLDSPPLHVHFHTPDTRTTFPHSSRLGIEEEDWKKFESWRGHESEDGDEKSFDDVDIYDDGNPRKEIDPARTKKALQEANIANPYILSPNVCIEA